MAYWIIIAFAWGLGIGFFLAAWSWGEEIKSKAKMGNAIYVDHHFYYVVEEGEYVEKLQSYYRVGKPEEE